MVTNISPEIFLRDSADSYWRDAEAFDEMGDKEWAAAYRAVAHELRKVAERVAGA